MRLKDKIAIVTGAADGIGLAICQTFTKEGAKVCMADINISKCEKEAKKIKENGGACIAVSCDVGDTESVEKMVSKTLKKYQQIDILVNNAAVAISGNVTEMSENDWDTLMNINLKGVFRGIKLILPYMLQQQSGSIINISSVQAVRSWNNWTAYAAAKGAINAMTTQLAGQFGKQNVRINSISPGAISTPMNQDRIRNEGERFLKSSVDQAALKRLGQSEEVAQTALFLASDEVKFITGADIKVDGGLTVLPHYFEGK
ncbi:MAG: SDR family oxidoreductase [Bacteroidota bacterium]